MERLNHKLDTSKLKTIKDVRNVFDTLELVASFSEDNEKYEMAKEYYTIPYVVPELTGFKLPRKSLEEISQEFDEKIDDLLVKTQRKFAVSKETAEHFYNHKFNRIIENFEYAKKNGQFPPEPILTYSDDLSSSNFTSSLVIKSGGNEVGYYTFGNGYLKYFMDKKPTAIFRFFMKVCLGFFWVDEK